MVAAFVTMAVVFTIGVMLLGIVRSNSTVALKSSSQRKKITTKPTSLAATTKTMTETAPKDIMTTLNALKTDEQSAILFYSNGCPWCRRFKQETVAKLESDGTLPMNFMLVEATNDLRDAIGQDDTLKSLATQVKGLPTTLIMSKRNDGLYFLPMVGFLPPDKFLEKLEEVQSKSVKA